MFCVGCDYVLDGLKVNVCPECARPFDSGDATTFRPGPVLLDDPVRLARMTIGDAVALRLRLESNNIRSALHEERTGVIGYAELPAASIWVDRQDEPDARQIMNTQAPDGPSSPWVCPNCNETIEQQFTMCWNCGHEQGEAA